MKKIILAIGLALALFVGKSVTKLLVWRLNRTVKKQRDRATDAVPTPS